MKISELPTRAFTAQEIGESIFLVEPNTKYMHRAVLKDVFTWIKEQAIQSGLTVELREDNIIFIKA